MIPFVLAAVGGYLIGDSVKDKSFAQGGNIDNPTNRDVMEEGDILDHWEVGEDLDNIVYYKGLQYLVTTDQEGNPNEPEKRATHWYDESLMEYGDGGKTKYRENRPSPSESATLFSVGTKKRGNDGYMWEIKKNVKGINRWSKIPGTLEESQKKQVTKKEDNQGYGRWMVTYLDESGDDSSIWVYANDKQDAVAEAKQEYWDIAEIQSVERINDGW